MASVSKILQKMRARAGRFGQSEDGNMTIESVIWVPIFAIILAFIMNISLVFFAESQMLRVVQDGNRAFSLGRLEDAAAVENYILANLANLDATLTIATTVAGGFISTTLDATAGDLMPLNIMTSVFDSVIINVSAQQIVEF
jgi:Flp pilus assembly protein TadG